MAVGILDCTDVSFLRTFDDTDADSYQGISCPPSNLRADHSTCHRTTFRSRVHFGQIESAWSWYVAFRSDRCQGTCASHEDTTVLRNLPIKEECEEGLVNVKNLTFATLNGYIEAVNET